MNGTEAFLTLILPVIIGFLITKYSSYIDKSSVFVLLVVSCIPIINWFFIALHVVQYIGKNESKINDFLIKLINK